MVIGRCAGRGPALVAFGHSWVAGRYPQRWVTPWPVRAARRLGLVVRNEGVGSSESPDVCARVQGYRPRRDDVVVVEAMLNDVRRSGLDSRGLARYERSLESIVGHLRDSPVRPDTVVLLIDPPIRAWSSYAPQDRGGPEAVARFAAVTRRVAAAHTLRVVDLGVGWRVDRDVCGDGVHPSRAGTRRIARAVVAACA